MSVHRPSTPASLQGSDEDRPGKLLDRELAARLLRFVRPHAHLLLAALLLLPAVGTLDLLQPMLIKLAIDEGMGRRDLAQLDRYVLLLLLCMLGAHVAGFLQSYALQLCGQRATHDLRNAAFRHLLGLGSAYFDRQPVGRLLTRVTSDADALNEMFAAGLVSLVGDVLTLLGLVVILLCLDWKLALVCLASAPVLALSAELFRRMLRATFRQSRRQLAAMSSFLHEHVQGMPVVQAYQQEERARQRFGELNEAYRRSTFRAAAYDACLFAWVEALSTYVVAALLWFAAGRMAAGALTFGVLVAFYKYVDRFFVPLRDLSTKYAVMQSALAAAERMVGLLETQERLPELAHPLPAAPLRERISFIDVSFSYGQRPALVHVSFDVHKGQRVAVVGHTGSGKTTLARLLLRQYDPVAGRIEIDGVDIRHVSLRDHRSRFAFVTQDVQLLRGTIADNLSLGDPALPRSRIVAAARAMQVEEAILRKGGYDAPVLERGANFSLGERQLLSFARALCRDPEILVLDEATASVDSQTEAQLQAALEVLLAGRTAIIIAHRLSTIRRCDEILVLHKGRLVERGRHEVLLARGGLYAKLCQLHFGER
ncbi:MAG: ABC transporter ATP-binding protein [Myxococcales bacterium]|nr:ABC transporter ATP-binding protein/permease [Myxococcota bacterium]MDW8281767.1 ABC transporter ATP-binding protein [Myxococcales bacterium]